MTTEQQYQDLLDKLAALQGTVVDQLSSQFIGDPALRMNLLSGLLRFADNSIGDFEDPDWDEPSTRVVRPMVNSNKPVIVAFPGPAVGVGISMTLAADFRLARSRYLPPHLLEPG